MDGPGQLSETLVSTSGGTVNVTYTAPSTVRFSTRVLITATDGSTREQVAISPPGTGTKEVMGWYTEGQPYSSGASFATNMMSIDTVIPDWFTTDAQGDLIDQGSGDMAQVVGDAHLHDKKIFLILSNNAGTTPVPDGPQPLARLESAVTQAVLADGFDGVNVDLEGMPGSYERSFSSFMEALYGKLHPLGLLVTVDVPVKTQTDVPPDDWAASFDYAILGKYSDDVIVMAYDEHSDTSGPGPVAGLPWVIQAMNYAASVIPAPKADPGTGDLRL